jgi:hypothetical protein
MQTGVVFLAAMLVFACRMEFQDMQKRGDFPDSRYFQWYTRSGDGKLVVATQEYTGSMHEMVDLINYYGQQTAVTVYWRSILVVGIAFAVVNPQSRPLTLVSFLLAAHLLTTYIDFHYHGTPRHNISLLCSKLKQRIDPRK